MIYLWKLHDIVAILYDAYYGLDILQCESEKNMPL